MTRTDRGRFATIATTDDALDVLRVVEGPVVTSADVADALDVSRQTARRKLNALVDAGALDKRETAGRLVYWRADERRGTPNAGREPRGQDDTNTSAAPRDDGTPAGGSDAAADVDVPGGGAVLEARRAAIADMYQRLRDADEPLRKAELLDAVDDLDATGYASPRSFWKNAVLANESQGRTNALVQLPGVEQLGNGRYRYTRG